MEFQAVVNRRKMVRSFADTPIHQDLISKIVKAMFKAPSAGFSQGTQILIITSENDRETFFGQWGDSDQRQEYQTTWPLLENAPVIILVCSDETAYRDRYAKSDKVGLPEDVMPWWYIDAGMSTILGLLSAVDQGLAANFTGVKDQVYLKTHFQIPDNIDVVGAILIGYQFGEYRPSSSARIPRRSLDKIVHYNRW